MSTQNQLFVKNLGLKPYQSVWQAMKDFTHHRTAESLDEIWLVEHPPVFTQGQAGKPEHLLNPGEIPIILSDRGGQVTYHGPGQLILYTLLDIKRKAFNIKKLVSSLENAILSLLEEYDIPGTTQCNAPGVYVNGAKIASVGLRIRRGCSYHGLSLNVAMDLEPFARINPCGYSGLKVVQIRDFDPSVSLTEVASRLVDHLVNNLGYTIVKGEV